MQATVNAPFPFACHVRVLRFADFHGQDFRAPFASFWHTCTGLAVDRHGSPQLLHSTPLNHADSMALS